MRTSLVSFILLFLGTKSFAYSFGYKLTPSIGFAASSLNMKVNSDIQYTPTNTNFYFVNLGFDIITFQAKFQQKDTEESRQSKVDSKIQDYQISLDLHKNWKGSIYYQDYKGYFVEHPKFAGGIKKPDMTFSHIGGQLYYVFNEEHSSFLIQDSFWDQTFDSSSWILSGGIDRFDLGGDLIPDQFKINKNQILQNLKITSYSLRGAYSQNWVWTHVYAGGAIGLGINQNDVDASYVKTYEPPETNFSTLKMNSIVALSLGYKWVTSRLGLFARSVNWSMAFDNIEISSNTSSSGFYYSMTF